MQITRKSSPGIFAAFREIDYDNGAVNRLEPERTWDEIPARWGPQLPQLEEFLSALTPEQLNSMRTECPEDRNIPGGAEGIAGLADKFLNEYFEDWLL